MNRVLAVTAVTILLAAAAAAAASAADFSFQGIRSLSEMRSYLAANFPLGTPEAKASQVFGGAGGQHYTHPEQKGVEKWVYDINLCAVYVWRWNISANFDAAGKLTQIYVNGEPVHPAGDVPPDPVKLAAGNGKPQAILKGSRPRPEASKGESALGYILYDLDTSTNRQSDEFIIGGGPSNVDPANMGTLHMYNAEMWRSIFDYEKAKSVVNYTGRCP